MAWSRALEQNCCRRGTTPLPERRCWARCLLQSQQPRESARSVSTLIRMKLGGNLWPELQAEKCTGTVLRNNASSTCKHKSWRLLDPRLKDSGFIPHALLLAYFPGDGQ